MSLRNYLPYPEAIYALFLNGLERSHLDSSKYGTAFASSSVQAKTKSLNVMKTIHAIIAATIFAAATISGMGNYFTTVLFSPEIRTNNLPREQVWATAQKIFSWNLFNARLAKTTMPKWVIYSEKGTTFSARK